MRITNSTILRGYNRNLNRLMNAKTSSEHKILSGRKFDRASESPLAAAKALTVRKSLYETEQYKENLDVAEKFYTEAETSLLQVSEELASIRETIIAAVNTTKEPSTDLQIYAQQLETKAQELCSIFNTNSAERMIFGGESDDPTPFSIVDGVAMYHGVPLNACSDATKFPYSKSVYIDIGIGFVMDDATQEVDPQTAMCISFNGADVTGCGADKSRVDINVNSLLPDKKYCLDVYVGDEKRTVMFSGTLSSFKQEMDKAFENVEGLMFDVTKEGVVTAVKNGEEVPIVAVNNIKASTVSAFTELDFSNEFSYTDNYKLKTSALEDGMSYSLSVTVGDVNKEITFKAGADEEATAAALNAELAKAFAGTPYKPQLNEDNEFRCENGSVTVKALSCTTGVENPDTHEIEEKTGIAEIERDEFFSKNYIQVTLDAAKALRNGDIEYANACIDRIVDATENLLVEIADLGCNEEYIDFMTSRFETRELNLKDRQETLEAADLESEITLMKTYEALYNAALQMSSSVVPNSIFNYIN